jgi:hypothetical protein
MTQTHFSRLAPKAAAALFVGAVCSSFFGCSSSAPPTGRLFGAVKLDDAPVQTAMLKFKYISGPNNIAGHMEVCTINDKNGAFIIPRMPAGTVKVVVLPSQKVTKTSGPPQVRKDERPKGKQMSAEQKQIEELNKKINPQTNFAPVDIPKKYQSFDTTDLTLEIGVGENRKVIELKK